MTESQHETDIPAGGPESRDRHVLGVVGLCGMIIGLLLLLGGVALGLYRYNSPLEQTIRRGMVLGAESLNGAQVEGGGVISDVSYTPPGPMAYVLGQPVTWVGGLIAFGGLLVFVRSVSPESGSSEEEAETVDEHAESVASVDDEPFDTLE